MLLVTDRPTVFLDDIIDAADELIEKGFSNDDAVAYYQAVALFEFALPITDEYNEMVLDFSDEDSSIYDKFIDISSIDYELEKLREYLEHKGVLGGENNEERMSSLWRGGCCLSRVCSSEAP